MITAPIHGKMIELRALEGERVSEGDCIFIRETMKMLNQILAENDGIVIRVHAKKGEQLRARNLIAELNFKTSMNSELCRQLGIEFPLFAFSHCPDVVDVGDKSRGHCGEISNMVLVSGVLSVAGDTPFVHTARRIVSERQMAATIATRGLAVDWCGSVWKSTVKTQPLPSIKEKMLTTTSRDTVHSTSQI